MASSSRRSAPRGAGVWLCALPVLVLCVTGMLFRPESHSGVARANGGARGRDANEPR